MNNPYTLKGKKIFVTGASSGIGQATAVLCSKMGAQMIITGRSVERLQQTYEQLEGDNHMQILGDLTNPVELEHIVQSVDGLDGVVLCAGQVITAPFPFNTREKYNHIFEVNFFSPVELLRLLVKKKKVNKDASVVFVSSVGGVTTFTVGNSAYGATKAAINSTMKSCALELASKKIRVNSVNPGMVNTKLIYGDAFTDEIMEQDKQNYPLKRYGEVDDIAYGIIYLLSDASSWVTGHSLVIDGGVSI